MFEKRLGNSPLGKSVITGLCSLVILAAVGQSDADAQVPNANANILFESSSGSYFELFLDKKEIVGGKWSEARAFAEQRFYKGIRGRLAVVNTRQTHEFISKNFPLRNNWAVWIGLRYICSNRSLVWLNGDRIDRGTDFEAWHRRWKRSAVDCSRGIAFMPVYYLPSNGRIWWQATSTTKGFHQILIEYPSQQ